ncbi:cyclin-dependent kinase inhibitor 1 isoform 1-T1 [Synchiropus picturatus]
MCGIMASHVPLLTSRATGPVRRNLFGPVDSQQLQVEYRAAIRQDIEEASQRWGYDFVSDKPLESSQFQWEGVPGTKVPEIYRPCMLGTTRAVGAAGHHKAGRAAALREKENIPENTDNHVSNLKIGERTPKRENHSGLKRKQTNITDFYQAKRRMVMMPRKSGE